MRKRQCVGVCACGRLGLLTGSQGSLVLQLRMRWRCHYTQPSRCLGSLRAGQRSFTPGGPVTHCWLKRCWGGVSEESWGSLFLLSGSVGRCPRSLGGHLRVLKGVWRSGKQTADASILKHRDATTRHWLEVCYFHLWPYWSKVLFDP
jgi:hypothetical protein